MKLKVLFTHTIGISLNMKNIFILKNNSYYQIYLHSKLPRFIFKIIEETAEPEYYKSYNNINTINHFSSNLQLNKTYKIELFHIK